MSAKVSVTPKYYTPPSFKCKNIQQRFEHEQTQAILENTIYQ